MRWHILTGEFPPASGGVGDYTALLANALADAGDDVHVWVGGASGRTASARYAVHPLPDVFERRSREVLREAWDAAPGTVLLQYVPNALGRRGMNVAFCRWLLAERRAGRDVRVMFHEPYFYFTLRRPWRNVAAIAQRLMATLLIRASTQLYYSSENWHAYLSHYGADDSGIVIPIPSTIPAQASAAQARAFRDERGWSTAPVVGHFGTYGEHVAGELLGVLVPLLDRYPDVRVQLIGRHGDRFRGDLLRKLPSAADRVQATGELSGADVAVAMSACDVVFQPYPDGVTTRRTSVMAGLRNGVATISTSGALTERVWRDTGAVVLTPRRGTDAAIGEIRRLLDDRAARSAQAARGRDVYVRHFSMELTTATLRSAAPARIPA